MIMAKNCRETVVLQQNNVLHREISIAHPTICMVLFCISIYISLAPEIF